MAARKKKGRLLAGNKTVKPKLEELNKKEPKQEELDKKEPKREELDKKAPKSVKAEVTSTPSPTAFAPRCVAIPASSS